MHRVLLTLRYDGSNYHGWQRQKNGVSVQEVLENAICSAFPTAAPIRILAVSRTDAFVHALNQKCVFDIPREALKCPVDRAPCVINGFLPSDIAVSRARFVAADYNLHKHVTEKTYRYQITNDRHANPLSRNYAWHVKFPLDVRKMRLAARFFIGKHDFTAFCASGSSVKSFERTIFAVSIKRRKHEKMLVIYIKGDGFLYNMARIIVGTLVYAGMGKIEPDYIKTIIAQKKRENAGPTAPPQGLTLYDVRIS